MLRVAQIYLLVAAVARGIDYITRSLWLSSGSPQNWSLDIVERSAPLSVWGAALIFIGVAGLLGELLCQWRGVKRGIEIAWAAHVLLTAIYVGFGAAAIVPAIAQGWGWSTPVQTLGFALGHAVFATAHNRGVSWR